MWLASVSLLRNGDVHLSLSVWVRLKFSTVLNFLLSLLHSHSRPFLGCPELQIGDPRCSGEPHHQDGICGWTAVVWLPESNPCPEP